MVLIFLYCDTDLPVCPLTESLCFWDCRSQVQVFRGQESIHTFANHILGLAVHVSSV